MFVSQDGYAHGYDSGGSQWARGLYLVVMCHDTLHLSSGERRLRAFVRRATLKQLGQFMPGTIRATLDGRKIVIGVDGTYGNTGLPHDTGFKDHYDRTIPYEKRPIVDLWDVAHDVPETLTQTFWSGGGHNGPGSEAGAMRAWAVKELATLRRWARPRA